MENSLRKVATNFRGYVGEARDKSEAFFEGFCEGIIDAWLDCGVVDEEQAKQLLGMVPELLKEWRKETRNEVV